MTRPIDVYVEQGQKKAYAGGLDWPGWDRGGRDEAAALESLVAAAPRYLAAMGPAARGFTAPGSVSELRVAERVKGDASTDFGIPAVGPAADERPVSGRDLDRLIAILDGAWAAVDAAARAAVGKELRKGPRGGGRELPKIVEHVLGGERGYLSSIGGPRLAESDGDPDRALAEVRDAARAALRALAARKPLETGTRRTRKPWTPRYFVRRSAWHSLDHAWEIEDRSL
jgi:hypothetical protein